MIKWIKGFQGKNSYPVYKYCDYPSHWDIKCDRVIVSCYGKGRAIDIRLMDSDNNFQHQLNITVDNDGKLKARVSEQTK